MTEPLFIKINYASKDTIPEDDIDYDAMGIERPSKEIKLEDIKYKEAEINVNNIEWIEDLGPIINLHMVSGRTFSTNTPLEKIKNYDSTKESEGSK